MFTRGLLPPQLSLPSLLLLDPTVGAPIASTDATGDQGIVGPQQTAQQKKAKHYNSGFSENFPRSSARRCGTCSARASTRRDIQIARIDNSGRVGAPQSISAKTKKRAASAAARFQSPAALMYRRLTRDLICRGAYLQVPFLTSRLARPRRPRSQARLRPWSSSFPTAWRRCPTRSGNTQPRI